MSTLREKLKDFALAAIPQSILRQPYRLGIAGMPALAKRSPDIETLYLLRSLTGEDWVPGASDIDVLIVVRTLGDSAEEAFLERFQRDFSIARRLCPVIGKPLGIYTRGELEEYISAGDIRALDAGRWKVLFGRELPLPRNRSSREKLAVDAYSEALLHHSRLHETWLSGRQLIGRSGTRDVVKAVSDILRYAAFAADPESSLPARGEAFSVHAGRALEQESRCRLEALVARGYPAMPSRDIAPLLAQTARWLETCAYEALRRFPHLEEPCHLTGGDGLVDAGRETVENFHLKLGIERTVWHNRLYLVPEMNRLDETFFERLRERASIVRDVTGCRSPLVLGPKSFVLGQRTQFYQQYGFVKNGLLVTPEGSEIVRPRIAGGVLPQLRNRRLALSALARERFGTAREDGLMLVTEYMPKLFHALTKAEIAESKAEACDSLERASESATLAIGEYEAAAERGGSRLELRALELRAIRRVLEAIREHSDGRSTSERS